MQGPILVRTAVCRGGLRPNCCTPAHAGASAVVASATCGAVTARAAASSSRRRGGWCRRSVRSGPTGLSAARRSGLLCGNTRCRRPRRGQGAAGRCHWRGHGRGHGLWQGNDRDHGGQDGDVVDPPKRALLAQGHTVSSSSTPCHQSAVYTRTSRETHWSHTCICRLVSVGLISSGFISSVCWADVASVTGCSRVRSNGWCDARSWTSRGKSSKKCCLSPRRARRNRT